MFSPTDEVAYADVFDEPDPGEPFERHCTTF
jgi:hypothetical protein